MPSEYWHNVDDEWSEIHPDLIDDVLSNLFLEFEAHGYIGTRGGGAGGPILIDDEDEDEPTLLDVPEPEPPRRRRRRVTERPTVVRRIGRFLRRLFGGQ